MPSPEREAGFLSLLGARNDASIRSVTMAQCTRAFVKGDEYGLSGSEKAAQASFA